MTNSWINITPGPAIMGLPGTLVLVFFSIALFLILWSMEIKGGWKWWAKSIVWAWLGYMLWAWWGKAVWTLFQLPPVFDSKFYVQIGELIRAEHWIYTKAQLQAAGAHMILVPLLYALFGRWFELVIYASLIGYFYWLTRSKVFTLLLALVPLLVIQATQVYADLPLAAFYFVGVTQLLSFMRDKRAWHLVTAGICFFLCLHTKTSGIPLVLIASGVFLVWLIGSNIKERTQMQRVIGLSFLGAMLGYFLVPNEIIGKLIDNLMGGAQVNGWVFVSSLNSWVPYNPFAFFFGFPTQTRWMGGILPRLFNYADWGLLWFAVIGFTALGWRRMKAAEKVLLAIICLDLVSICWALSRPDYYRFQVDGTLIQRLVLHIAPIAIYYVFRVYEDLRPKNTLINALGEAFSDQLIGKDGGK